MSQRKRRMPPATGGVSAQYSKQVHMVACMLKRIYTCEVERHRQLQRTPGHLYADVLGVWHPGHDPKKRLEAADRDEHYVYQQIDFVDVPLKDKRQAASITCWHQMAKFVLQARMDPAAFIRRQFLFVNALDKPPWPSKLLTQEALTYAVDSHKDFIKQQKQQYRIQVETAARSINFLKSGEDGMSSLDATLSTLWNKTVLITPLFRYCLAASEVDQSPEFNRLLACWREAAALQLVQDMPAYLQAWDARYIPQELQDNAEEIYASIYQQ